MYKARVVAQWFVNRAIEDINVHCGDYLTPQKLHNLMYYAQGAVLGLTGVKLFSEKIYAETEGPNIREVTEEFGSEKIGNERYCEIDFGFNERIEDILEDVYQTFGQYSSGKLHQMAKAESPWKQSQIGDAIDPKLIKEYFREHHLSKQAM